MVPVSSFQRVFTAIVLMWLLSPISSHSQMEDILLSPEGVPCTGPHIFSDRGDLVVKWNYNSNTQTPQWIDWVLGGPILVNSTPPTFVDPPKHPKAAKKGRPSSFDLIDIPGRSLAVYDYRRPDSAISPGGEQVYIPIGVQSLDIQVLTRDGWQLLYSALAYEQSQYVFDPVYATPYYSVRPYGYDLIGNLLYMRIHREWSYGGTIADTPSTYIFNPADRSFKESPIASFQEANPPNRLKIADNQYLECLQWPDKRWRCEIVDSNKNVLRGKLLTLEGNPSSLSLLQNYMTGTITILWGSDNGVKGTFLGYDLLPIAENVQISRGTDSTSSPVGFYRNDPLRPGRNDTLFVVWEDYRNGGVPNIYGRAFLAPKALGVEDIPSTAQERLRTRFDLTSQSILVEFAAPAEKSVEIELFDLLGHRLDRQVTPPGTQLARFAAVPISSGTYLVQARSDGTPDLQAIGYILQ